MLATHVGKDGLSPVQQHNHNNNHNHPQDWQTQRQHEAHQCGNTATTAATINHHPHRPNAATSALPPQATTFPAVPTACSSSARYLSKPSGYEAEILGSGAVPLALGAITRANASPSLRNAGIGMLGTLAHEHTERKMATERKHAAAVDAARERAAERNRRGHILARELQAQLDAGAVSASAPSKRSKRGSRESRGSKCASPETGSRRLGGSAGSVDVDSDATTESEGDDVPAGGARGNENNKKKSELCFEYANLPKPCAASSIFFASKKTRFLESLPAGRAGRYEVEPGDGGRGGKRPPGALRGGDDERDWCSADLPKPMVTSRLYSADQAKAKAEERERRLQKDREERFTI